MKKEKTILLDDNYIELVSSDDIYKIINVTDEDGSIHEDHELVKQNVKSKQTVLKSEIIGIQQVINERGNIRIHKTKVLFRYTESIITDNNYLKLQEVLFHNKHKNMGY